MLEQLLQKLPWQDGRQKTGYKKLPFFEFNCCDAYVLYYPKGSEILPHVDKVEHGRHYRLNIILKQADLGGLFICDDYLFQIYSRLFLFRPDIARHEVTRVHEGYRLVLSLGWLMKK